MNYIKYIIIVFILFISIAFFVNDEKFSKTNFIQSKINEMTIDEKIGQMLMIYDYSEEINDELIEQIKEVQPGGFVIFSPNITTYDNTKKLIADISSLVDIPMFIAVDQEGGKVQRLKSLIDINVTDIPDMQTLGKTNNEYLAYEVGRIIGLEVSTLGINTVFGPVLDVGSSTSSLSTRIISDDKDVVKRLGIKISDGIKSTNVLSVYKHFPGIGNSEIDSHLDLPVIDTTKDELLRNELIPFKEAVKGANMVMVGHVAYPNVTGSNIPASLSRTIINDLLREELNYNGIVITDALNMKAITNNYTYKEIFEYAINAGVDILLMPKEPKEAIRVIKELLDENKITEERIDKSVEKILKMKYFSLDKFKVIDERNLATDYSKQIISQINSYDND